MTERERLLDHLSALERDGRPGAVATVVQVDGSSYRRAGARMLFGAGGERVGMLSGGCFDLDDRARRVMDSGRTSVHRFDTTGPADVLMGSGSGCQGVVDILLAPVEDGHRPSLRACLEPSARGQPSVLATVVDPGSGGCRAPLGARLLVTGDGAPRGSLGDAALEAAVERDARSLLGSERVDVNPYPVGEHAVQVMIEGLTPERRLAVFGAGDDAVPLAEIAAQVGLHVTLVDHRPAYADPERHPAASEVLHVADAAEAVRRVAPGARTACISVTHDYLRDAAILRELRTTPAAYVGVVGPRSRAERLIADSSWDAADRGRLYCPAGLDVGAQTPEEIALSVIAEILGVLEARTAGHLRDRAGPIHDRPP
ncbi:MAG: XdhC family protein [Spirochaetaceae bacterium]|nr:XdhC family protein [Spirochaetaceae bacterium]